MMGLAVSLPIMLIINGLNFPQIEFNWLLLFSLTGGLIGFVCVVLSSHITPKIGILYVTILLFVGQLSTGVIIDGIREGTFPVGKIIGGVLIVTGLFYLLRLEKVKSK